MPNRKISRRKSRRPQKSRRRSGKYSMVGDDLNWEHPSFMAGYAGFRITGGIVTFQIPKNLMNNPHRTGERIYEGNPFANITSFTDNIFPPIPLRESRIGHWPRPPIYPYWTDCCNQTLYTLGILKTPRDQEQASTIGDFITEAGVAIGGGWTDGKIIKVIEHRVWEYSNKTINLNLNLRNPLPFGPPLFDPSPGIVADPYKRPTRYILDFIDYVIANFDECTSTICISKHPVKNGHCFIIGKLEGGLPIIIDYQQSIAQPIGMFARKLQKENAAGRVVIPCDITLNIQMEQLYYIGIEDVKNYLVTLGTEYTLTIPYGNILDQPRLPAYILDDPSKDFSYYIKQIITDNEKVKFRRFLDMEQCWKDEIGHIKFYTPNYPVECNEDSCYFGLYKGYKEIYRKLRPEEISGCYLLTRDYLYHGEFSNIRGLKLDISINQEGLYISHVCIGKDTRGKSLCKTLLIPSIIVYTEQINQYRKRKGKSLISYLILLVLANNIPAQRCYISNRFNFIDNVRGKVEINIGNNTYYAMIHWFPSGI